MFSSEAGSRGVEDSAVFYARRAGHAAAMIANLHLAGSSSKTACWEAEHAVWTSRCDDAIATTRLGRTVASIAADANKESFVSAAVRPERYRAT